MGRCSSLHRKRGMVSDKILDAAVRKKIKRARLCRQLTFSHLDLDTGVPFGHIPHTSHHLRHLGGMLSTDDDDDGFKMN